MKHVFRLLQGLGYINVVGCQNEHACRAMSEINCFIGACDSFRICHRLITEFYFDHFLCRNILSRYKINHYCTVKTIPPLSLPTLVVTDWDFYLLSNECWAGFGLLTTAACMSMPAYLLELTATWTRELKWGYCASMHIALCVSFAPEPVLMLHPSMERSTSLPSPIWRQIHETPLLPCSRMTHLMWTCVISTSIKCVCVCLCAKNDTHAVSDLLRLPLIDSLNGWLTFGSVIVIGQNYCVLCRHRGFKVVWMGIGQGELDKKSLDKC